MTIIVVNQKLTTVRMEHFLEMFINIKNSNISKIISLLKRILILKTVPMS